MNLFFKIYWFYRYKGSNFETQNKILKIVVKKIIHYIVDVISIKLISMPIL